MRHPLPVRRPFNQSTAARQTRAELHGEVTDGFGPGRPGAIFILTFQKREFSSAFTQPRRTKALFPALLLFPVDVVFIK